MQQFIIKLTNDTIEVGEAKLLRSDKDTVTLLYDTSLMPIETLQMGLEYHSLKPLINIMTEKHNVGILVLPKAKTIHIDNNENKLILHY